MKNLSNQLKQAKIDKLNEMLKSSIELAFQSLANDIGDQLFDYESLQISLELHQKKYPEEAMNELASSLDDIFLSQMNQLTNKIHNEVSKHINLQEILYKQKIS